MRRVYLGQLRVALPLFVRASSLHIGAAAAAVSLRGDLVQRNLVSDDDFSRCFAIARLTPGTNLIALYAALGYRIAEWLGAAAAITVGAALPATITVAVAALYSLHSGNPLVSRFMSGAKAGALAVLAWGVVRLAWPVVRRYQFRAIAVGVGALALALSDALSPFVILVAGVIGAFLLNTIRWPRGRSLLLLRATVTSFSGFASVPVVRGNLVLHRQVLTDDELNAALAISQASPGPLGLYVVVVGYFVAGVTGALLFAPLLK